jgi:hypothetical protein
MNISTGNKKQGNQHWEEDGYAYIFSNYDKPTRMPTLPN